MNEFDEGVHTFREYICCFEAVHTFREYTLLWSAAFCHTTTISFLFACCYMMTMSRKMRFDKH